MTEITLALPFALPPPELAKDLLRALKTPALATLLSRHSALEYSLFDNNARVLPHEAWLTRALGLGNGAGAPLATACMRGCGLHREAEQGHWFMLQPAYVQISRTHFLLTDLRNLQLSEADSRGLYDIARPYFDDIGQPLLHGAPGLWFMRADDWAALDTASPDAATTQSMGDWLPEGDHARAFRKLQNEIQMLWHEHPINEARQARGLQAVNSCWLWGGAGPAAPSGQVAIGGGTAWMAALAAPDLRAPTAQQLIAKPGAVMLADLIAPAQVGDWADWLARMQRIEQEWFAPLLAALKDGRIGSVKLVLSHRFGTTTVTSSKLAQRKFWRQPSLNSLLKQP
ncbi:hypothetical protein GJ697_18760 [Pseudoduganella sp. FT25W]|uniref:Phosphoglycerate mutase n=1 Tax=Duganella alba TaxID=2666081 RepID=A0A6L5QJC1_9BURK|nr:hypothetical protein [Duganella alba]MRX09884.1 hypothetical protein [Duganella alba]MRX17521.1 hypothetical protein [Duganella alba]